MTHDTDPLERQALGLLRLRGAPGERGTQAAPSNNPVIALEEYEKAIGVLKRLAAITGEAPATLCRRLGITGERRRMLVPRDGGGRWRLTADERRASYRARDPIRNGTQQELAERRAAILGITLDSPEWLALMASDRAFAARMKKMRDEAGPPHPMRTRHYAKK